MDDQFGTGLFDAIAASHTAHLVMNTHACSSEPLLRDHRRYQPVTPPVDGCGQIPTAAAIKPGETLVFVVDLVSVS